MDETEDNVPETNNRAQYRNWCFTLNNPTRPERIFWRTIGTEGHENVMFISYQSEWPDRGSNGVVPGTYHYQGYIELKKPMRLSTMKNVFGRRVAWFKRRGTQLQAYEYTIKNDHFFGGIGPLQRPFIREEWGTMKRRGTDRPELCAAAISLRNYSFKEICRQFPTSNLLNFRSNQVSYSGLLTS